MTLSVNSQITDAVTQSNVKVIAESPASKKVMIVDACRSEAKGTETHRL